MELFSIRIQRTFQLVSTQMVENVTFYTVHTRTCAKRTKESEPLKTCVRGTGKTSEKRAKQLIFTNGHF